MMTTSILIRARLNTMTDSATRAAAQHAKRLCGEPFVVLDVETTGFDGYRDRIVQIGIVNQDGEALMDTLVNPCVPILNSDIHGITDAMVADAPTFPKVYAQLMEALHGRMVLAYNHAFDWPFILGNCKQFNLMPPVGVRGDCIMELFAQYYGDWNYRYKSYRWKKLVVAADFFQLKFEGGAHSALSDAKMALAVLKKMAEE